MTNMHDKDDMSMDDILKSIRKYVSEEAAQKHEQQQVPQQQDVVSPVDEHSTEPIILPAENIVTEEEVQNTTPVINDPLVYSETSKVDNKSQPFNKLSEILRIKKESDRKDYVVQQKSSGITLDEFFRKIAVEAVEKWISLHLRNIVEEIVQREIEKIKSE